MIPITYPICSRCKLPTGSYIRCPYCGCMWIERKTEIKHKALLWLYAE